MAPIPKIATPAKFDEAAIRTHVEMLHRLADGLQGVLVVSTFFANPTGDRDLPGAVTHHVIGDVDGMVASVMSHAETPNANAYCGLQVMRKGLSRGARGTEADIVAVLGLVADMDADTGNVGTMPVVPDLVLETSPGNRQPFVLFDKPMAPGEAKALAAALKRATGSDHGTGDIAHVWRIPGTLNWPNKKKLERGRSAHPCEVKVVEQWAGTFIDAGSLAATLAPWAGKAAATSSVTIGELPDAEGIVVSATAATLLAADDVGDRSAHASRVVEQMAFEGLVAEEACALFLAATGNWLARYPNEERARKDFERLWSKFGAPKAVERERSAGLVAGLVAKSKEPPVSANDNAPGAPKPTSPYPDIFEWTADRYVGEPPPIEWLVEGVVPLGVPGMVAAMGDTGKSFTLLELHRRVAFGSSIYLPPILGGKVVVEGTSVMLTSEDDVKEVHRRLAALDPKEHRLSERGKKMIVVPLPSAGGVHAYWREDRKLGLVETDAFKRLCDQLLTIRDLRLVTIDPLASFAHLNINEDPAAGQFVCSSLGRLAAETGATVFIAHHMKKRDKAIETLGDARESIRGSTALVDGLRLAYAMWPADEKRARGVCKTLGQEFVSNKVVLGGVVKANGAAKRIMSTYVRSENGLLIDSTGIAGTATGIDDIIDVLVVTIEAAAADGQPYTKTGSTGVFAQRERLPDDLRNVSRHRLESAVDKAVEKGKIKLCLANGTVAKWLDVPGGPFDIGLGHFRKGGTRT